MFGGGMTSIEPRAGNVHGFSRRRRGRGVAKVRVREVKVRVPEWICVWWWHDTDRATRAQEY